MSQQQVEAIEPAMVARVDIARMSAVTVTDALAGSQARVHGAVSR